MGQPDQFGSLARELVALAPSVIACVGRRETAALQAATTKIPIVFMQVNDPIEQGFVVTLARPGGNTTGFTQMSAELDPKRLELLHEIVPSLSRAAFLVNPNLTPVSRNDSPVPRRPGRAWALPCGASTPPPRPI